MRIVTLPRGGKVNSSRSLWYGRFDRIELKKKEDVFIKCQKEMLGFVRKAKMLVKFVV